jgi:hypothetical protein
MRWALELPAYLQKIDLRLAFRQAMSPRPNSALLAGRWILRHALPLWFGWSAIAAAGMILQSWWILGPALAVISIAVPLAGLAAIEHLGRAIGWCRETASDFPPILGNPQAPKALLGLLAYWLGLLLASGALIKGIARYVASP